MEKSIRIGRAVVGEDGLRRMVSVWNPDKKGSPILPEPGDGLRICNRAKAAPGYVLYSPDHSNKFLLIDMDGQIVHEWPAWTSHFGYMLPNGHLLLDTQFSPDRESGIVELDWQGRILAFTPCLVHHDFQLLENGNLIAVCHRVIECERIGPGEIVTSHIIEMKRSGEIVWQWKSEEHLDELERLGGIAFPRNEKDWIHTNTVQVLPETPSSRDPRFKAGNVIISHRNLDSAVVIDRPSGEIVWVWGPGTLSRQHATIVLPNGRMLCFDNGTQRKWSAVWEVDPLTDKIVWSYEGRPRESFFASALSNAQRLLNGNTFICSGSPPDTGRLFEVTPEGEIVWEFQNPYAEYAEGEKIVYRAYKYPPQIVEPLLKNYGLGAK